MAEWEDLRFDGSRKARLDTLRTNYTGEYANKDEAAARLRTVQEALSEVHDRLYAQGQWAVLLILQGMDASGKDGVIKHVMAGLNPQGTDIYSFKAPSAEEHAHDYLWRVHKCLPERGKIGVFNRSYYEEVLVVRVHNLLDAERLPAPCREDIWAKRFHQIRHFEEYLWENGILPVKVFLHVGREEQAERLLDRIEDRAKNYKFNEADLEERKYWDQYQSCYEDAINETAAAYAPWYVVPADKKWYARLAVSEILLRTLKGLDLRYPELGEDKRALLVRYRDMLLKK